MDKITMKGKDWYSITDFMEKYTIGSSATVYKRVREGQILADQFMGKRIFAMK